MTLPTGAHYEWQETVEVSSMLEADPTQAVAALSALAHPVRLQLLHKVLHGRRTVPSWGRASAPPVSSTTTCASSSPKAG